MSVFGMFEVRQHRYCNKKRKNYNKSWEMQESKNVDNCGFVVKMLESKLMRKHEKELI